MVRRRSRSRDWGQPAPPVWPGGGGGGGDRRRRSCAGGAELERLPANMAAEQQLSEASAVFAPLPLSSGGGGGGGGGGSGSVPVLFCFSVFARPSTLPHGSGYEMLIQKFLSLYGDQLDMHRKFVVQLFSEEWSQYIDLPKGFLVNERCKLRLVPLQIQVGGGEKEQGRTRPGVHGCGGEGVCASPSECKNSAASTTEAKAPLTVGRPVGNLFTTQVALGEKGEIRWMTTEWPKALC
uniref:Isochorismatase domain containing 1 n=1 Tax=Laticauda laticaudata TaxID=8630 RepID=A0A8C5RRU0_LATLA